MQVGPKGLTKPLQALCHFYISLLLFTARLFPFVKDHPFGQTVEFEPFEGTHNLAFDVRKNLAPVSVGRGGEEGGQTGALQLSGSTQSGMGHPASNCPFIQRQRDLHISMSLRTAREVRKQRKGREAREKGKEKKDYFDQNLRM